MELYLQLNIIFSLMLSDHLKRLLSNSPVTGMEESIPVSYRENLRLYWAQENTHDDPIPPYAHAHSKA